MDPPARHPRRLTRRRAPATVSHLDDGCWSIRFDDSTNDRQSWTYCPRGGDLVETGGRSSQRRVVGATAITNLTSAACETSDPAS